MKFNKKILANGLTVLHERRDVPVTTVMLAVKYGSAYESNEEKGMAHFMEHLCFKGTAKRSVDDIAREVESVGGILNAFTHEEVTAYHVKLPSKHLEIAMDVIFDTFFNASFPEVEVEKEAQVVCEEIKMYRDNPRAHVFEKIKDALYKKPFGAFIAGTEENVKGFSRDKMFDKHRQYYVPANAILSVVGNNDFEEILKFAEEFSVERGGDLKDVREIEFQELKEKESRADLHQANLALGFHFPKVGDQGEYASRIFAAILGEGMSSKLFKEVREKRGLVYGVKTDLDVGKNYGYMIIWAGTSPGKVDEVNRICLEEFSKMENISESEVEAAKVQVIGNHEVAKESSDHAAVSLVMEEITGERAEDYYEFVEKINSVSVDEVRELAKNTKFASFSLGP